MAEEKSERNESCYKDEKKDFVRSGIRTHAHIRGPERSVKAKSVTLESGALDRSAILTLLLFNWLDLSLFSTDFKKRSFKYQLKVGTIHVMVTISHFI